MADRRRSSAQATSPVEIGLALVALTALAVGVLALSARVWLRTATVDVALSYVAVVWLLARGLNR